MQQNHIQALFLGPSAGGGGQVVSVLSFYSDDLSLNPAEDNNFSQKMFLKRKKMNKKRPGLAHLKSVVFKKLDLT